MEEFTSSLAYHVKSRIEESGYKYDESVPMPDNFGNAIKALSAANGGKGVVILIDEYDAPVGHCLDSQANYHEVRKQGKGLLIVVR